MREIAEWQREVGLFPRKPIRFLAYIDIVHELHPDETLTVILPEFVVAHWWEYPLHNQTAFRLKAALLARPGIVVTDIPQHLSSRPGRK
jgi:hypothetical protein